MYRYLREDTSRQKKAPKQGYINPVSTENSRIVFLLYYISFISSRYHGDILWGWQE
jgi:hypothetical protein